MGLFDRFKKEPPSSRVTTPPGPPPPKPSMPPPALPQSGKITRFDTLDEIGDLELSDGSTIRIGRAACDGFEPMVGLEVRVDEVGPRAGDGWRASSAKLESPDAEYDALLASRDQGAGVEPLTESGPQVAAATCETLGWIVVLMKTAPPAGPKALETYLKKLGLAEMGIRIETQGNVKLGLGKTEPLTYVGTAPMPGATFAAHGGHGQIDRGGGFIGMSLGLVDITRKERLMGLHPGSWEADGPIRNLSRIATTLLENGTAVWLPKAARVFPKEVFLRLLGDLEDTESRPFGAWVDWAVDDQAMLYASYGMSVFGLPDVGVQLSALDDQTLDEAHQAILYACHQMVWTDEELEPGQTLDVPIGVGIGPRKEIPPSNTTHQYRAEYVETASGPDPLQLVRM